MKIYMTKCDGVTQGKTMHHKITTPFKINHNIINTSFYYLNMYHVAQLPQSDYMMYLMSSLIQVTII